MKKRFIVGCFAIVASLFLSLGTTSCSLFNITDGSTDSDSSSDTDINDTIEEKEVLVYTLLDSGTEYEVTYNGTNATEIVIPSEYNGLPVTSIGNEAFDGCTALTSITLPESITNIGEYAFQNCYSLSDITLPNSVTTIGAYAFYKCNSLTSIVIPDSVISLGDGVFQECSSLESVTIGKGIKELGGYSFGLLPKLTYVYFNAVLCNDLDSWGSDVFNGSGEVNGITLIVGNEVTRIPSNLFYWNGSSSPYTTYLKVIKFEDNSVCESIGANAFCANYSLVSVTIPSSMKNIEAGAFSSCYKLVEIYNYSELDLSLGSEDNGYLGLYALDIYTSSNEQSKLITTDDGYIFYDNGEDIYLIGYIGTETDLILPSYFNDSSYTIYDYAFVGNGVSERQYALNELRSIVISDGVSYINMSAFYYCLSLESVTFEGFVTRIYNYAFYSCTSLKEVTFEGPGGVLIIDSNAFFNCKSLTSITLPSSLYSISSLAFNSCISLTEINVDGNNKYYASKDGVLFNKDLTTLIYYPEGKTDTSYTIPSGVTSIGDYAFYNCTSLASITIPDSVTSISSNAFDGCASLKSVYITDLSAWCNISFDNETANPLCYANNLYLNNELVTDIELSEDLTSIGDYAFYNCTSLASITIPEEITYIGIYAFYGCSSLQSATFEITEGWTYTTSKISNTGYVIPSESLSYTTYAASFLTDTYSNYYWHRN